MRGVSRPSFWKTSSLAEKLDRLKKSYEKYVIKNDEGCWDWKGSKSKPYGSLQYGLNKKSISAHQASWIINNGEIPAGMFICHHCDNPSCTKPDHLFLGTPTDNVRDMIRKGRRKTSKSNAKLTQAEIINIKKELQNNSISEIAKKYGVSYLTIWDIKNHKTWTDIQPE